MFEGLTKEEVFAIGKSKGGGDNSLIDVTHTVPMYPVPMGEVLIDITVHKGDYNNA